MEESGRWKFICKAVVQVRIQGLPVLQKSIHHFLLAMWEIWVRSLDCKDP